MHFSCRVAVVVAIVCLSVSVPSSALGQGNDVPTMTNSSLERPMAPLPNGWPAGARDVQLRGAVCDMGYGKAGGRKFALAGDDVLPVLGTAESEGLDFSYIGVRRVPFVTRADVLVATFSAIPDEPGAYAIRLQLSPEGAEKADSYLGENTGGCIALAAGGKAIWAGGIEGSSEEDVLSIPGPFSVTEAIAIVELFDRR